MTRASSSPAGARQPATAGSTLASEMKETSIVARSGRYGRSAGASSTRVHALDHVHARVVAKAPVELAVADVEGDHPLGAALQQAVGEAARRGADVEAGAALDVDLERVERVLELEPAARDVARRSSTSSAASSGTSWLGFVARGPSRADPHPAGAHRGRRAGARAGQAALGEQGVDPAPLHVRTVHRRSRSAGPTRRPIARICVTALTHESHIRSYLGIRMSTLTSNPTLASTPRSRRSPRRRSWPRRSLLGFGQAAAVVALRPRGAAPRARASGGGPAANGPALGPRGLRLRAGGRRRGRRPRDRDRHRRVGRKQSFWSALASPRWR